MEFLFHRMRFMYNGKKHPIHKIVEGRILSELITWFDIVSLTIFVIDTNQNIEGEK